MRNYLAAAFLALVAAVPPAQLGTQTLPSTPPSHWIALTANIRNLNSTWVGGISTGHFEASTVYGIFVRDDSGSTYKRWLRASSPDLSFPDIAILIKPSMGARWEIDYDVKNLRRTEIDLASDPELAPEPMTLAAFKKIHNQDEPLGSRIISGIECVGYRVRVPHTPKMHQEQAWFAPSLNFLAVKHQESYQEGKVVSVILEDIHLGPPDPRLFLVPLGFSIVH